jgi:hypothetical protein
METKVCGKCKVIKDVCNFGKDKRTPTGLRSTCNECRREESREYRKNNTEKRKKTLKKFYFKNKESELLRFKIYRENNSEKRKETLKKHYENNKTEINRKQVLRNKKRYKTNYLYRVIHNLRIRTKEYLKQHHSNGKFFNTIGCKPNFLREHLEKQFKDGMSWENYGSWHIDHIIPLSSAKNIEEISKLCHYTNLQPLWASENLSKGNKIIN